MLPLEFRLKSKKDIERVFKNGKTVKSSFLFLKFCENNLDHSRIAFSVGLRYSKKAVKRNRAKRILREAAKTFLQEVKPGFDLVFFLDKNFNEDLRLEQTQKQMKKALTYAKLVKNSLNIKTN
ncbi:MAG: ribonuclease P protein component [Candidatus Moraniibacteriota bacterium]